MGWQAKKESAKKKKNLVPWILVFLLGIGGLTVYAKSAPKNAEPEAVPVAEETSPTPSLTISEEQSPAPEETLTPEPTPTEIKEHKIIALIPRVIGRPGAGHFVANVTLEPSIIQVTGTAEKLKDFRTIELAPLDLANRAESFEEYRSLSLPEGVELESAEARAKISVELGAVSADKEVTIPVTVKNTPTTIKTVTVAPLTVRAILSGSVATVAGLNGSDLEVSIDISGQVSPGTVTVDVTRAMVAVPDGVEVLTLVPSAVTLTLTES